MGFVTLTRKELYDLVWSEPMMRLARRYGLSGSGLAKICFLAHPAVIGLRNKSAGHPGRSDFLTQKITIRLRFETPMTAESPPRKFRMRLQRRSPTNRLRNDVSRLPRASVAPILLSVRRLRNCSLRKQANTA